MHFIYCFTLFKRLHQRYPSAVPTGTLLVLRTHPDSTSDPSAISVLTLKPIIWRDGQELCLVAYRGLRAHYTVTSSSLNTQQVPLPLRVPVMLLLLEHDWILVRHLHFGSFYGCSRLIFGAQVAFAHIWDSASVHLLRHASDFVHNVSVLMVGDHWRCMSSLSTHIDDNEGTVWMLVLGFVAKRK